MFHCCVIFYRLELMIDILDRSPFFSNEQKFFQLNQFEIKTLSFFNFKKFKIRLIDRTYINFSFKMTPFF
jgi:hypothetical protein